MGLYEMPVRRLDGAEETLADFAGEVLLVVNVASRCGYTPQYRELETVYENLHEQGLEVLGFPCNQFGAQEPGTAEDIASFCSVNYGVTFPMFDKVEVNGADRHPLFAALAEVADDDGNAGDVAWNFEKFLIDRSGTPIRRFRSKTTPDDPALIGAIEQALSA